ncbi:VPLPA-CTERM sorting domain-containing protein [Roseibium aggregatum]|uniref:VPLPA-CTERM sorting domain-containing protein n=1 Tax=Roseibium aggregatum TaxID=187304 RepID=A0A939EJN9_9HYPH|nr:VPLPA-CTERM sorting domain-containing protein [Roseibium aggregatum]MBN9672909.1 VPLPA-CTERM sorting domain-containing protein [Roseibium aggregatum]
MKFLKVAGMAAAVMLAASAAANAMSVTATQLSMADLDGIDPVANISATGGVNFFQTLTGNQFTGGSLTARTPWEGSKHEDNGVYSSVQAGGSAVFEFAELQTGLSMIWGSPDTYNDLVLTFIVGGAETSILASTLGVTLGSGAALLEIAGVSFDSLVLSSSQNAFEFANLNTTTAVPLPAGGLLLVTAMGGLALVRRRKSA